MIRIFDRNGRPLTKRLSVFPSRIHSKGEKLDSADFLSAGEPAKYFDITENRISIFLGGI